MIHSIRRRMRHGDHEYVLLEFHEPLPEGYELVALGDSWLAERRLRDFALDDFNLRTMRDLAHATSMSHGYEPASEAHVIRQMALSLSQGLFRLARVPLPVIPGTLLHREKTKAPSPAPPVDEKLRLMLQIVDDTTDEPLAGIKLRVKPPEGAEQQVTTDSSGRIELPDVPPGRVIVTSVLDGAILAKTRMFVKAGVLPSYQKDENANRRSKGANSELFLVRVIEHKVSDGETLEGIAEAHELTVEQLTQFNWGTTDPAQIQRRLLIEVGCKTRDESGNFVLTSRDNPGILFIPRPLVMDWMALEQRHIWRAKTVAKRRPYLFSA